MKCTYMAYLLHINIYSKIDTLFQEIPNFIWWHDYVCLQHLLTTAKNKETKTHTNYHAFLVTSLLISSSISVTKPCSLLTSNNRQANSVSGPLYPGYLIIGAPSCLVCSFNRLNINIRCGTQQHCISNLSIVRPSLLCYNSSPILLTWVNFNPSMDK